MHDVIHTMFTWAQITDAVFEKDQEAKNGIVHFIDEVIYPIPAGSLLEVLGEDDRFRVLTEAVEVANFIDFRGIASLNFWIQNGGSAMHFACYLNASGPQ